MREYFHKINPKFRENVHDFRSPCFSRMQAASMPYGMDAPAWTIREGLELHTSVQIAEPARTDVVFSLIYLLQILLQYNRIH
jgi:hypothetical protein